LGPEGIEVNITHQFQEIRILLAENGFVSVLKERAVSSVAPIVGDGIAGEQPPHEGGQRDATGSHQKVRVVGEQGPSKAGSGRLNQKTTEAIQKVVPVSIILKDR
jgi:hypothetical protein